MTRTIRFETDTCSRCGGTGRMPYSAYNGVCFKCNMNGRNYSGQVLTRNGKAAYAAYIAAKAAACPQVAVTDLEVGQKVSFDGGQTWRTVAEPVDAEKVRGWSGTGADRAPLIGVVTQKMVHLVEADKTVPVLTREAVSAAMDKVAKRKGAIITDDAVTVEG